MRDIMSSVLSCTTDWFFQIVLSRFRWESIDVNHQGIICFLLFFIVLTKAWCNCCEQTDFWHACSGVFPPYFKYFPFQLACLYQIVSVLAKFMIIMFSWQIVKELVKALACDANCNRFRPSLIHREEWEFSLLFTKTRVVHKQ